MTRSIAIIGTLDTKGDQVDYLAKRIQKKGCKTIIVDVGVLGSVPFEPDITRYEIARAANTTIEEIIALKDEAKAMEKMADGACNKPKACFCLHSSGACL